MHNRLIAKCGIIAYLGIFLSNVSYADIFSPSFGELRKWNCSIEDEDDCNFNERNKEYINHPVKKLKVIAEADTKLAYLRDVKAESTYLFGEELAKNSPLLIQKIVQDCRFRIKGNYCSILATVNFGIIEKIENWSVHRYQIAE